MAYSMLGLYVRGILAFSLICAVQAQQAGNLARARVLDPFSPVSEFHKPRRLPSLEPHDPPPMRKSSY
ncbi:hypothetical protein CVT25_013024 [Psilocybe cyanescens]|uniref:Uncharacterized protein n=1 Tax=Psilocybe cyanescens TaxID=93625 RepID=A0A409XLU8_PSICY|nr:hypothetical protein CVT25_013024 [Psilocybe cyanescens]